MHTTYSTATRFWVHRFSELHGEYVATGSENALFSDVIDLIGFTETLRLINFYLLTADDPSLEDFADRRDYFQRLAHDKRYDRMYRHPDPRIQ